MSATHRIRMWSVDDARGASTRYRVLAHRQALEQGGFQVETRFPLGLRRPGATRPLWRAADMLRDLYEPADEDVLFLHRKLYLPGLASRLRRSARPVIFDYDDTVDLPPPRQDPTRLTRRRYRRNFEATVAQADLVVCGNAYLASRLPHDRYEILPTPVDTAQFHPRAIEPAEGKSLGWVGSRDNLRYLEALAEPLRELSRRHPGLRLIVVADLPPRIEGLDVEFRPWSLEREVECFSGIGVGLMPLADDPWTRGKCAFKALQYMALGIPTVASPVGMNREVIVNGDNGYLVADDRAWVEAVDALLSKPALSHKIGLQGRRTVERRFSSTVLSQRLVEIVSMLLHEGPDAYWEASGY